jgi:hypothetical protein
MIEQRSSIGIETYYKGIEMKTKMKTMEKEIKIDEHGLLFSSPKMTQLPLGQCVNGVELVATMPELFKSICDYLQSQDWAEGYDGLSTRLSTWDNAFPPEHDCAWVIQPNGRTFHLPRVSAETWPWWGNIESYFLFLLSTRNSKFNYTDRVIYLCRRG